MVARNAIEDLDERSREIFRHLVESYLESGDPIGSRTLSRRIEEQLSAASVRNVMQDLETLGLIASPHVSAGRIPTESGLRLFLDGFLQVGDINPEERRAIEDALTEDDRQIEQLLNDAVGALSGLSHCAALVLSPKRDAPIDHVEIVPLSNGRAMAVLVTEGGSVENRLFQMPAGLTASAAEMATNFLNAHMRGMTLEEARMAVSAKIADRRADLDQAARSLVERGIAEWSPTTENTEGTLLVRGLSHLLKDTRAVEEIENVRQLFDDLERQQTLAHLIELTEGGEGIRVFLGSENKLFSHSGSSLVLSPFTDEECKIVGAIGVIGPTRLNYARILPIVDYTARMVGRLVTN